MYSVIIKNGTVIDGTGNEPYRADIAIQGNRIVAISEKLSAPGDTVIDASGLTVSPGFIDIHTHTDATIFKNNLANSKLLQGVTSDVTGNCGLGAFPVSPAYTNVLKGFLQMNDFVFPTEGLCWRNFSDYATQLEQEGLGINLIPLVSHGALRTAVMGAENREPSVTEQNNMNKLLTECLSEGAWGMSCGLIYPPSGFAKTPELIELAKVLAKYQAIYASHIRNESTKLLESITEAITIAKESGAKVEVSHLKAIGKPNWGKGKQALQMICQAQADGVDIGADQYPYEASSTALTALTPSWAQAGGVSKLIDRLNDPSQQNSLLNAIHEEMTVRGGPERVMISTVNPMHTSDMIGKNVLEISHLWHCSPEEAVLKLLRKENAAVHAIYFSMSEEDVNAIISSKAVAVGSDGRGYDAKKDAKEAPHPRSYGTFPRVLGHFVRDKKLLTLPTAVFKMTGLPAERLGLKNRGLLKVGMCADITIFNAATISDRSEYTSPHQYPVGIEYVFVNGRLTVKNHCITGVTSGKVLRKL